jgi:solute carrier family 25 folate transporter 32
MNKFQGRYARLTTRGRGRYTLLKSKMDGGDSTVKLSPGQHLLASAQSGFITAVMTNPIWVVKTRMFTTSATSPAAYKNVFGK